MVNDSDIVVSTTGVTSRELFEHRKDLGRPTNTHIKNKEIFMKFIMQG